MKRQYKKPESAVLSLVSEPVMNVVSNVVISNERESDVVVGEVNASQREWGHIWK